MSVLVGTLIVLGVTAAIGAGGAIWHECTEEDRAKEKIKQLKAENEQLNSAKNYVSNIKVKLESAKEYLASAKKDFTRGGHVYDDVPLANSEFKSCIDKLTSAIKNAKKIIDDCDETIAENNKKMNSISAEINEKNEAMKNAGKKQMEKRAGPLGSSKTTTTTQTKKYRHR